MMDFIMFASLPQGGSWRKGRVGLVERENPEGKGRSWRGDVRGKMSS